MIPMRVVQLTMDSALVDAVDRAAKKLGKTRSAFAREALRRAVARVAEQALEKRHGEGYRKKPVRKGEFDAWESEQAWGDE